MKKNQILFDQFSRYQACSDILDIYGPINGRLLDIGSGPECLLGHFVDKYEVSYLDPMINESKVNKKFKGDIFDFEFQNFKDFHCITAIDVLEHIEPDLRQDFLNKISCQATDILVLGFPSSDDDVAEKFDSQIDEDYKNLFGTDYRWLKEHIQYGLPSANYVAKYLENLGWNTIQINHGHVPWLRKLLPFTIKCWDLKEAKLILKSASENFNENFYSFDFNPPSYRKFIVCTKKKYPDISFINSKLITKEINDKFNSDLMYFYEEFINKATQILMSPGGYIEANNRLELQKKEDDLELFRMQGELDRIFKSRSWRCTKIMRTPFKLKLKSFISKIKNKF